jgi:hypothetical protein
LLEVYPMEVLEGKLCKVPGEDFEMVSYTLVRFKKDLSVNSNDNLLFKTRFNEKDEGILVIKYDLEKGNEDEFLKKLSDDDIIYLKTLWIARGSFCE